jgi:protease-4
MKTFGKVILTIIVIVLVLQVMGIAITYYSRRIKPNTILTVRIAGDVPEQAPQDALAELLTGRPTTVTDIVEALERARADSRITGIELPITESTMNMAKIQEIRDKIREFNRAGKFSVAYLEFATNQTYYLASACQTVILLPKSLLYIRGMMASTTFLRGTLDKLGIYPDLYHIGEYKNAMNVYTEKKYTSAHREATQALLEDWYQEYVRGVAESRGLKPEEVEQDVAKGPFSSEEALRARLVDQVAYWDQARELVRKQNHGSDRRLSLRAYLSRTSRETRHKLAVIYATGMILPGRSGDTPLGEEVMGSDTISEQFRRAREDDDVKAVVLRVDSPGGVVFPSEVMRREVEITKRQKPVVVSMSDVAASGGYWIAMSADKIVAEPGTITGSIGVVVGKYNLRGLFEKLGLSEDLVTTTENSTLDWPFQNFTPAQRKSVQKNMQDIYNDFLAGVAEGRHMKRQDVDKIAQGRVWTGEQARRLGLVDELGGLHTALARARALARIPAEEKVSLLLLPPRRSLWERILDLAGEAEVLSSRSRACGTRAWLRSLESLARQPVWALLPTLPEAQ